MNTPLRASSTTAGLLMSGNRFEIPEFQRDYAWGAGEVEEFWDDLRAALDDDFYFLGLVILTGSGERKTVVDGQQRLITLSLLAAALRQEAIDSGRGAIAADLQATFIAALDYSADERVSRIRLSSERDRDAYIDVLNDGTVDTSEAQPTGAEAATGANRLSESFRILSGKLSDDLTHADRFSRIGQWTRFLKDRLFFAVFEHPDAASAYRVFEVVNTRGKELTAADLLKSLVLSRTPAPDREDRYASWMSLVHTFDQAGSSGQMVQYIRHVVTLGEGHIAPRDLYDRISSEYGDPEGLGRILEELQGRLPLYLQMMEPSVDGPADADSLGVFSALNQLGVIVVRPLLLAIADTDSSEAGMKRVLRLVVRRIVVGYLGTGNVERRFSQAAKRVVDTGEWRSPLEELSDLSPSRSEFQRQLSERSMNKQTLAFLHESILEQTLTPSSGSGLFFHLIRPRVAPDWNSFPDDQVTRWGSTIGNTTLATQARRPRGTNTWEGFLERLKPMVDSREQGRFEGEEWGVDEVRAFGVDLADRGADLWYDDSDF